MKRIFCIILIFGSLFTLAGCSPEDTQAQVAATTLPVYEFTSRLCQGTDISVTRLITEEVSCLHDYTLQTRQMRAMEAAQLIVISGGGLEDFLELETANVIDASASIALNCGKTDHDHGHTHENDPHIWLSPANAQIMVNNIANGLKAQYPQYADRIDTNQDSLIQELQILEQYGTEQLADLSCKKLITFHDGFGYFAEAFGLTIVQAVEEESGSEASAQELIELITLVREHDLPAIFTERSGSTSAASIISAETGTKVFALDMAMSGDSYFDAMYHNIKTVKEALG